MDNKMTRRDLLYEQYESAMISLILDEIMEKEGERFLRENEDLKKDGSFMLSPAFEERCLKTIKQNDSINKRKKTIRAANKIISHVSVFFLACFLAISIPFCTVSAFRAASLNLLIEVFDKSTSISTDNFRINGDLTTVARYPTWLPTGSWKVVFLTNEESRFIIKYMDSDSNEICYFEIPAEGSTLSIDTENAEIITDIAVNGSKALMSVKEGKVILTWVDDNKSIICDLEVHGSETICTPETALRIAESIK